MPPDSAPDPRRGPPDLACTLPVPGSLFTPAYSPSAASFSGHSSLSASPPFAVTGLLKPRPAPRPPAGLLSSVVADEEDEEGLEAANGDSGSSTRSFPPPPSSPPPPFARPAPADRRATHNAIERARRESLNARFLSLARALPNMAAIKRPSKSLIVNKSIEWISETQIRECRLARENAILRTQVHELRLQLHGHPSTAPPPPPSSSQVLHRTLHPPPGTNPHLGPTAHPAAPHAAVDPINRRLPALSHPEESPAMSGLGDHRHSLLTSVAGPEGGLPGGPFAPSTLALGNPAPAVSEAPSDCGLASLPHHHGPVSVSMASSRMMGPGATSLPNGSTVGHFSYGLADPENCEAAPATDAMYHPGRYGLEPGLGSGTVALENQPLAKAPGVPNMGQNGTRVTEPLGQPDHSFFSGQVAQPVHHGFSGMGGVMGRAFPTPHHRSSWVW